MEQPRILARGKENVRPFTVEKQVVNLDDEDEEYEEINNQSLEVH